MSPFLVQQSSRDREADVVATEIGKGGIVSTSIRRSKIPVIQMLAPPSISDEGSSPDACITLTYEPSSPRNPYTRGKPTTRVMQPMLLYGVGVASSHDEYDCAVGMSKGNSKGVVGDTGLTIMPESIIEPCGYDGGGNSWRAFSNGT